MHHERTHQARVLEPVFGGNLGEPASNDPLTTTGTGIVMFSYLTNSIPYIPRPRAFARDLPCKL